MTAAEVQAWLRTRKPAPPAVLAERLSQLLASYPPSRLAALLSLPEALGALGVCTLDSLEGRPPTSREVALDLLAADAFVTYAFEAAAQLPDTAVEPFAAHLLAGIRA